MLALDVHELLDGFVADAADGFAFTHIADQVVLCESGAGAFVGQQEFLYDAFFALEVEVIQQEREAEQGDEDSGGEDA